MPLIWQRSSRFWARHKIPLYSNSPHFRRARFYIRPTKRLPWRGSFPQRREMSRSDKGNRPRKRFRHTVGRGSSTFSFNLCIQKTAAFPRQSKRLHLHLLRLSVSAAGGGHLHSKPFSSPMVYKRQFPQKHTIKNTPQLRARYFVVHHRGLEPRTH